MNLQREHLYEVLIVGAGIAGTEVALACAKQGLDTLLVTTLLDSSYTLFTESAELKSFEETFMQNALAAILDNQGQVKAWDLHRAAKYALEHTQRLHCLQSNVSGLIVKENTVVGVDTWEGVPRFAKRIALCVGSFLEARLTVGILQEKAGRLSEMSYDDLYHDLCSRGFQFEALKLGADIQPPYTVECKVFAQGEIDAEKFHAKRLANFYAAGLCAFGYINYEQAALQGLKLAASLAKDLDKAF
jgi:tRNA U34 5-carboxymethylaminomethyl modifying enzyme MnmG/GidA